MCVRQTYKEGDHLAAAFQIAESAPDQQTRLVLTSTPQYLPSPLAIVVHVLQLAREGD